MKTISGHVTSTKPISLSKAAKILSNFSSVDNGASQSVSIYLSRASEAFNELVQLHKELKGSHSDRKARKRQAVDGEPQFNVKIEANADEADERRVTNLEDSGKPKKHRPADVKNEYSVKSERDAEDALEEKVKNFKSISNEKSPKKEQNDRENRVNNVEDYRNWKKHLPETVKEEQEVKEGSMEDHRRKKDKKKHRSEGGSLGIEEEKRKDKKKKRTSSEIVVSSEQSGHENKKKRRKIKAED